MVATGPTNKDLGGSMATEANLTVNSTAVREWLNHDTNRPVAASEFMEFWKVTSAEDRQLFGDQARALLGFTGEAAPAVA